MSVSEWAGYYPDERAQLEALAQDPTGEADVTPEEARRRKIVHAVLRLSLRGLPDQARRLLFALSCFDPATGGPESLAVAVAGIEAEHQIAAPRELNRLHQRSVLSAPTEGRLEPRYTMHRLMREVVRLEAGDQLGDYEARFFDTLV